jgi:hypothetical protein
MEQGKSVLDELASELVEDQEQMEEDDRADLEDLAEEDDDAVIDSAEWQFLEQEIAATEEDLAPDEETPQTTEKAPVTREAAANVELSPQLLQELNEFDSFEAQNETLLHLRLGGRKVQLTGEQILDWLIDERRPQELSSATEAELATIEEQAYSAYRAENDAQALALYRLLQLLSPSNQARLQRIASFYAEEMLYEEALLLFSALIEEDEGKGSLYLHRAKVSLAIEDLEAAEADAAHAKTLQPQLAPDADQILQEIAEAQQALEDEDSTPS